MPNEELVVQLRHEADALRQRFGRNPTSECVLKAADLIEELSKPRTRKTTKKDDSDV